GEESRDFATFLSRLRECGYLGVWRVLDAQFAGVPQRRRRIFFIGHLGDWRPAAAVLLEPESLRGDPPPRGAAGQGIAPTVTSGAPSGGPAHGSRSGSGKEGLIVPVDDEAIPLKDPSSKGEAGAL